MIALIRFEIRKTLSQNKCLLGLGCVILINVVFILGFIIKKSDPGHISRMLGEKLLKELFNVCVYVASIVSPCAYILFPVLICIIVSYVFAGEYEIGTLRLTMVRPVSRLKILIAKWVAVAFYGAIMVGALFVSSLAISWLMAGRTGDLIIIGDVFALPFKFVVLPDGIDTYGRIILTYFLSWLSLTAVASMAFLFSVATRNLALSAIISTTVYLSCHVVTQIPFLSGIHPFLPTRYIQFCRYAMLEKIPWEKSLFPDMLWTAVFALAFMGLAAVFYERRDF